MERLMATGLDINQRDASERTGAEAELVRQMITKENQERWIERVHVHDDREVEIEPSQGYACSVETRLCNPSVV